MQKVSRTVKIINKLGLHARAAALFVKTANRFTCDVFVTKGKNRVNGKSIMGLLMLAAGSGSKIQVDTNGVDAIQAADKLEKLVANGFNET
jgi:phosphocarrier protein